MHPNIDEFTFNSLLVGINFAESIHFKINFWHHKTKYTQWHNKLIAESQVLSILMTGRFGKQWLIVF